MNNYYWFWLCNIKGIGNVKIKGLINKFKTPKTVYYANEKELLAIKELKERDIKEIIESRKSSFIKEKYYRLQEQNIRFITITDESYPKKLKNIYDYPFGLYIKGNNISDDKPTVAVIGARSCSEYGRSVAATFSKEFARMGIQVVSGMARGIDAAAHVGCINAGGSSFAVLGCGVDICYPRENIEIYMNIQQKGGIISEYCPGIQPLSAFFPMRNRIISALSDVVVVVEARQKSGSLITIDQALEQNRDVYAIPGRVTDKLSDGCNNLIRMGAQPMLRASDILDSNAIAAYFKDKYPKKMEVNCCKDNYKNNLFENNEANTLAIEKNMLYSCLNLDAISLDEILLKTGLDLSTVNQLLLELILEGMVDEISPNCYIRSLR